MENQQPKSNPILELIRESNRVFYPDLNHTFYKEPIEEFIGEYHFLSNSFPCKITLHGITFPSSEHTFQASKSTNLNFRKKISNIQSPQKAKQFVESVIQKPDNLLQELMMYEILILKFTQNKNLKKKLLETLGSKLINGETHHDSFWGVCNCGSCPNQNLLGKLLMKVRYDLNKSQEK